VDTLGLRSYKNVPYSLFSTTYINEGDSVLIPLNEYFERKEFLTISGEVKNPGRLKWGRGISAYDAIILANGFTGDADMDNIEISTKDKNTRSYNTKSVSVEESKQINLESGDLVSVKKIRIRDNVAFVNLSGEVKSQGSFGLKKPYENIFEILNRAGGLTDFADENGAFLIRRSEVSASDSSVIGSNNYELKDSRYFKIDTISISQKSLKGSVKFILQNMDEVFIPGKSTIVRIQGQVNAKKTVSYSALKNFNGFLRMAGGVSEEGVSRKAYVVYPNGSTRSTRNFLGYKFRPRVVPGSTIIVPQKSYSKEKSVSPAELAAISGTLASISTMAIAVIQLLRP
jgi:protein involved in polysaccharide export with SLBB domain